MPVLLPTGFEGNLTEAQAASLKELRDRLLKSEYAADFEKDPGKDRFLLQFLRATMKDKHGARVFNVDAALTRLIATFKWRREYKVDELRDAIEMGTGELPDKFDLFQKAYPTLDTINSETGLFVRFARFGRFVTLVDTNLMTATEWMRCFAYDSLFIQHKLRKLSVKHGKEIGTYISVIDAAGLSLVEVANKLKFIQFMSNMAADNFPEMLGQTLIIRCPWMFPAIFNLAKPFIDKDTVSKFVISSSTPLDHLKGMLPPKDIPKEFGGEGTVPLGYPPNDPQQDSSD